MEKYLKPLDILFLEVASLKEACFKCFKQSQLWYVLAPNPLLRILQPMQKQRVFSLDIQN
jgi:hypothetical protein